MLFVRRGVVFILSAFLFCLLFATVGLEAVNLNLSRPSSVESWLVSSGVDSSLPTDALDQAQTNTTMGIVSLTDPGIASAVKKAFPPSLVSQNLNKIINANYQWLEGKTTSPNFRVDLSSAKSNFANGVSQAVVTHLSSLPVCSTAQLSSLSTPIDPLTINCLPAGISPQTEGTSAATQINNSSLLADPVLTANNLSLNQSNQSLPYYQRLSKLPAIYQLLQKLPFLLLIIAVIICLLIFFIAPSRRKGLRRLAIIFILVGLLYIVAKFIAAGIVRDQLGRIDRHLSISDVYSSSLNNFIHLVVSKISFSGLILGLLLVLIGGAKITYLYRSRTAKPAKQTAVEASPSQSPPSGSASSINVEDLWSEPAAPNSPPPTTQNNSPELRTAPLLRPGEGKLSGQRPPKPKPPKLIQ